MISIGQAQEDDYASVQRLINLVQPHAPWSDAHFQWQYLLNPSGKAKIWIAKEGNQVVASYAAVPHRIFANNTQDIAWMVQDVLTCPEFRGKGLMHRLASKCVEDTSGGNLTNFTFPNEHSYKSFLRNGWHKAFPIPHWVAPSPEIGHEWKNNGAKFEEATIFLPENDAFLRSVVSDCHISITKDVNYLNWRYFCKPNVEYLPFELKIRGELRGVVVYKKYTQGVGRPKLHICELLTQIDDFESMNAILSYSCTMANAMNACELSAWCPVNNQLSELLKAFGFKFSIVRNRFFIVSNLEIAQKISSEDQKNLWLLAMGDSDVY